MQSEKSEQVTKTDYSLSNATKTLNNSLGLARDNTSTWHSICRFQQFFGPNLPVLKKF